MLTILIAVVIIFLLVKWLWPSRRYDNGYNSYHSGFGGAGSMMTGLILGYLLDRYLISPHQYDMWKSMSGDELESTLIDNGIVSPEQFADLQSQAEAGELTSDLDQSNTDFTSYDQDASDQGYDNYDDELGSSDDDFGGFDV